MNLETAIKLVSEDILVEFYENDWDNKTYFYYNFDKYKIGNICCKIQLYVKPSCVNIKLKLGNKILLSNIHKIDEENIEHTFQEIVRYIFHIPNKYKYSKLLDELVLNTELERKEEYITAVSIITHEPINNCSVCYDENSVLTDCNHNLCRECYYNIKKKLSKNLSFPKCPICRTQIKNYESDDEDSDYE